MKNPEEILEILESNFPDTEISIIEDLPVEKIIVVPPADILTISYFLRDSEGLEFDSLMVLSGVDDANGEKPGDLLGNFKTGLHPRRDHPQEEEQHGRA